MISAGQSLTAPTGCVCVCACQDPVHTPVVTSQWPSMDVDPPKHRNAYVRALTNQFSREIDSE